VNFNETLKCLAKGVAGMNVDVSHAPYQGTMQEWFAATIIQANYRGRIHRRQVWEKRVAMRAALGIVGEEDEHDVDVDGGAAEEKPPEEIERASGSNFWHLA
jgi:hypothetical protein